MIPQLSGVAAWAASLSGALRATLIADEPFALLKGDLSGWSDDDRTSLVKSLLDAVENKKVTNSPYSNAEAYAKLDSSRLGCRIAAIHHRQPTQPHNPPPRPCYRRKMQAHGTATRTSASWRSMRAIHPQVRAGAVSALKHCGDASVPLSFVPWRPAKAAPILTTTLKAMLLTCSGPTILRRPSFSVADPAADNYFGAYALFQMALPDTVKDPRPAPGARMGHAIDRAKRPLWAASAARVWQTLMMFKAWQVFDNPELTRPFLEHVAVRLRQHGDLCRGTDHDAQKAFINSLRDDVDRRHKFLLALCAGTLNRIDVYDYRRAGLLLDSDLEWLLSIAPGGSNPAPGLNCRDLV